MKCPQCGSEAQLLCYTQYDSSEDTITNYQCLNKKCLTIFNVEEEEHYQERLNNVLSKFTNIGDDIFTYKYELYGNKGFIAYQSKVFKLGYNIEEDNMQLFKTTIPVISLKTVESLLADLEVKE